jgi:hypothetical protein
MSPRTPSSLKWLIEKRKHLHGELIYVREKVQVLIEQEKGKEKKLEADIEAIDRIIRLHDVGIDPSKLPSTSIYRKRHSFKYGELTRLIYKCLGSSDGNGLTTHQITDYVVLQKNFEIPSKSAYKELQLTVRYRLKALRQGRRLVNETIKGKVLWRLY